MIIDLILRSWNAANAATRGERGEIHFFYWLFSLRPPRVAAFAALLQRQSG
jgi:hypothetical protein